MSKIKIENNIFNVSVSDKNISSDMLSTLNYDFSLLDIAKNNPDSYILLYDNVSEAEVFRIKLSTFNTSITELLNECIYTNVSKSGFKLKQDHLFNSSSTLEFYDGKISLGYKLVIVNDGEDKVVESKNELEFIFDEIKINSKTRSDFSETKKIIYENFDGLKTSKFEIKNEKNSEISYIENESNFMEFEFVPGVYYTVKPKFSKNKNSTTVFIYGEKCSIYNEFPENSNITEITVEENLYGKIKFKIGNQNYKFADNIFVELVYNDTIFEGKFKYPQESIEIEYNTGLVEKCGIITANIYTMKNGLKTSNNYIEKIKVPLKNISGTPEIEIKDDFTAEIKNIDLDYLHVKFILKDIKTGDVINSGYITKNG